MGLILNSGITKHLAISIKEKLGAPTGDRRTIPLALWWPSDVEWYRLSREQAYGEHRQCIRLQHTHGERQGGTM